MPKAKDLYICKGWHSIAYNFFTSLFLFQLNICEFNASTSLATYLHKFSVVVQIMHFFGKIWEKFVLDLVLIYYWKFFKNYTKTASSNGANGKEFGEQHQQQRIKKAPYVMTGQFFFNANKVIFIAHFSWVMNNWLLSSNLLMFL